MKRLLAFLLVLIMSVSLIACTEEDDVRGDVSGNDESNVEEESFSLGTASGGVYTNKFIGIGCKLDSAWTFYDDEQIKELNNFTTSLAGEDFADAVADAEIVYDMYASKADGTNIVVNLEKGNAAQIALLDTDKYFSESVIKSLTDTLKNMGCENINHEKVTVKIGDEDFSALRITSKIYGTSLNQLSVVIKCKGYVASVCITTMNEDKTDEILGKFYLVD